MIGASNLPNLLNNYLFNNNVNNVQINVILKVNDIYT